MVLLSIFLAGIIEIGREALTAKNPEVLGNTWNGGVGCCCCYIHNWQAAEVKTSDSRPCPINYLGVAGRRRRDIAPSGRRRSGTTTLTWCARATIRLLGWAAPSACGNDNGARRRGRWQKKPGKSTELTIEQNKLSAHTDSFTGNARCS